MAISEILLFTVTVLSQILYAVVGIFGLIGAVLALTTREDAFLAGDRHPKAVWTAMLFMSAIVLLIPLPGLSIFSWIGAVIVGLYWFDVRPQLKNIINGNSGW